MATFATMMEGIRGHIKDYFLRAFAIFVLLGLFFVVLGGVSQNDRWKITNIAVVGANVVESNTITAAVQEKLSGNYYFVYSRNNSYLFPAREIEATLLQMFPRLASVRARRVDDHAIGIEVTERKPFALWCGEVYGREMYELNDCWFIDETGFIFDHAPIFSEGVYPEIYGSLEKTSRNDYLEARIPPARFEVAHLVAQKLQKQLGDPLRLIIKSDGEYGVIMKTCVAYSELVGVELRFKDGTSTDTLIKTLLAALPVQFAKGAPSQKKLLYIDLRFGNKVFFGFEH